MKFQEYTGDRNALKERHGTGYAFFPNGDQYSGHYRRGQRHGKGLYVFASGARYLGDWRCNLKSGTGKFYYLDGSTYTGQWKLSQKHGHGVYTYPNGDQYVGSWYKDKRHGVGKYIFKEAQCIFNGTWCAGVTNGPGEIIHESHRFHGTWNNSQYPIGPGVYSFKAKTMAIGYMTVVHDAICYEKSKETKEADSIITSSNTNKMHSSGHASSDCDPVWRVENILAYDYSKLPPNPVPLPLDDSDVDDCEETPRVSEMDDIDFEWIEEEIELEKEEECVDDEENCGIIVEDVNNVVDADIVENVN